MANNDELIASAMKAIHSMNEKSKKATQEAKHIIESICIPFIERDKKYLKYLKNFGY